MFKTILESIYTQSGIAVLGVILAVVFYLKGKERKRFSFYKVSSNIISKRKCKYNNLSITYSNKPIDDFSISKFTIWNSGNRVVNNADMVSAHELKISAKDNNCILDIEAIAMTDEANNFAVNLCSSKEATISFDYVAPKDGLVLQVMHTGDSTALTVDYKIKGGQPLKEYTKESISFVALNKLGSSSLIRKISVINLGVLLLLILCISVGIILGAINNLQFSLLFSPLGGICISVMYLLAMLVLTPAFLHIVKREFIIGIPRKLKKYARF